MGSVVLFYRFVIFVVLFVFFFFCFFFFCSSSLPAFILFAYNGDSIALVDPKATPICTPTSPRRSNACPHFRVVGFDSFKSTTITKKSVEEQETLEDRNRKYENLLIGLACLGSRRFSFSLSFFFFAIYHNPILLDCMLTTG